MKNKNKVINPKLPEPESNSNFTSMVMRAAVARICQSAGFTGTSQSVLDIFTSISSKYIGALTQSAATSASLSGLPTPTCNLHDIVYALEDLSSNRGFTGASDVIRPLLNSSQLTDLIRFSTSIQKNKSPNPISILHQQQQQQQQEETHGSSDCGLNMTENVKRYPHIPDWLPPIPDMKSLLCGDDSKRRKSDDVLFGRITTTTTKKEDLDLIVGGSCDMGKRKLEATELSNNREKVRFKMGGKGVKRLRPPLTIMGINGVNKTEEFTKGLVDLKTRVYKRRRNIRGCQNLEKKKKKEEDHLLLNSNKIIQ